MRFDDLDVYAGKRRSNDYEEFMFDGTDLFNVTHFPEEVRMSSEVKSAAETYGTVRKMAFPNSAPALGKILWITFCRGQFPLMTPTNFPPILESLVVDNIAAVTVDYFPTAPFLLKNLKVWAKGRFTRGLVVPASAPFEEGFLTLELEASSPTNLDGTLSIPRRVVASAYNLDRSEPPKHYLATKIEYSVETISTKVEPITPPKLIGKANVLDMRYIDNRDSQRAGINYHYYETNGSWVSRTNPDAVTVLASKEPVQIIHKGAGDKKGKQYAWVGIMFEKAIRYSWIVILTGLGLSSLLGLAFVWKRYNRA